MDKLDNMSSKQFSDNMLFIEQVLRTGKPQIGPQSDHPLDDQDSEIPPTVKSMKNLEKLVEKPIVKHEPFNYITYTINRAMVNLLNLKSAESRGVLKTKNGASINYELNHGREIGGDRVV